jgi:predicted NBD/HSP70 family sugar kinase
MRIHGIEFEFKNIPKLDRGFIPIYKFNQAFLKTAKKPIAIAITRNDGLTAVHKTHIHGTRDMQSADLYYVDRIVKTMLWMKGGYKIHISGDEDVYSYIKEAYSPHGSRSFDYNFMSDVYERPFEVVFCKDIPESKDKSQPIGRHLDGCRIGFDAGASARKVSAVINGEPVYSERVLWQPATNADPDYHFNEIVTAFQTAASHMPRVDAIGISSAGIYINNRTMAASLFLEVPEDLFEQKVKDIYIRAAKAIGNVPVMVCNDGDVTALAGAMSLGVNNILGISMGTSEAVGYVDDQGNITGWLNELAFVPVDANPCAMKDEWSGDIGCGVKYFSQDAVIKLAQAGGIEIDAELPKAEKLMYVQELLEQGNAVARDVFASIGVYLGHTLAFYHELYKYAHVLILGGVTTGKGGDIIVSNAKYVIEDEYPEIAEKISVFLPDEQSRKVAQSVAAASLPVK